jgi:hypothetical protein
MAIDIRARNKTNSAEISGLHREMIHLPPYRLFSFPPSVTDSSPKLRIPSHPQPGGPPSAPCSCDCGVTYGEAGLRLGFMAMLTAFFYFARL